MGMWGTINFFAIGSEQAQDQAAIFAANQWSYTSALVD